MINQALYIFTLAGATHLIRLCNKSPHKPTQRYQHDTLFAFAGDISLIFMEFAFLVPCIYHILVAATLETSHNRTICPNIELVNEKYFTWTTYSTVALLLIYTSAALRLLAFRSLGKNFTFELAEPDHLMTTGVYSYVQHPSYGPLWVLLCASFALFLPLDGTPACLMPDWARRTLQLWPSLGWPTLGVVGFIIAGMLWTRVRDEEKMLKEAFGKEWIEWHSRTARFVPYLF